MLPRFPSRVCLLISRPSGHFCRPGVGVLSGLVIHVNRRTLAPYRYTAQASYAGKYNNQSVLFIYTTNNTARAQEPVQPTPPKSADTQLEQTHQIRKGVLPLLGLPLWLLWWLRLCLYRLRQGLLREPRLLSLHRCLRLHAHAGTGPGGGGIRWTG